MHSELHSNANRSNKDNHRDGTQLDTDQAHNAKQLYCHHSQDKNLRKKRSHSLINSAAYHLSSAIRCWAEALPPCVECFPVIKLTSSPRPTQTPPHLKTTPLQTQHWLIGLAEKGHKWTDLSSPQISGQRQFEVNVIRRALPVRFCKT